MRIKATLCRGIAAVVLAWTLDVQAATAWYNGAWPYRVAVTIDHTKVSGPLTNFPLLSNYTNSSVQHHAQSDGDDLRFTSSDGTTKLTHEIKSYTGGTGALLCTLPPGVSAVGRRPASESQSGTKAKGAVNPSHCSSSVPMPAREGRRNP